MQKVKISLPIAALSLTITGVIACYKSNPKTLEQGVYQIPEGFILERAASAPLVNHPVALDFDEKGRMWVVELNGYMPNIDGLGEEAKTGQIRVLYDRNHDGVYDHAETFLDKLVLPRAVKYVHGGLLYAEPPNLWWVEEANGKAGARILVDSAYAVGGNVEHQANGLLYALDNWIYSAKSDKRYRYRNGKWEVEKTAFRGQWGICQDDFGRLYYNHNSHPLQTDGVFPGLWERNPWHAPATGYAREVARDLDIRPIHVTGVNRGYEPWMRYPDGRVKRFTSACGPVIYRGDQWPAEFQGLALTAAPEANLIRAERIQGADTGRFSLPLHPDREFLAAADELFRPVSLYNGPDGALYIVDYHRGIIQHKTYMTGYLREYILEKGLDQHLGDGRILRLAHSSKSLRRLEKPLWELNARSLVSLLSHPNAWHRETAQRLLIERNAFSIVQSLAALAKTGPKLGRIHALWTLEALSALTPAIVETALSDPDPDLALQGLRLAALLPREDLARLAHLPQLLLDMRTETRLHAVAVSSAIWKEQERIATIFADSAPTWSRDRWFRDALLSGMKDREKAFALTNKEWTTALTAIEKRKQNAASGADQKSTPTHRSASQMAMYGRYCGGCHGREGEGVKGVAPPLRGSEWVSGSLARYTALVLQGIRGPISVNGTTYSDPAITAGMSGVRHNPYLSSEELSMLLTYVRIEMGGAADGVSTEEVLRVKELIRDRTEPFSADELTRWIK